MNDDARSKTQLLEEIDRLRRRVDELEVGDARRRHAEEDLYQSRQMLQLILDTIPVRVFWKDRNFAFMGCNRLFARDAGLDVPDAIIGKSDFDLSWRDVAHLYREDDREVMAADTAKLNIEEPQTTPTGGTIWLRTNKVPLHNSEGTVIGVLGTYEDITERKRTEEAIQYERNLLRTLVDNLPDLIYVKDMNCRKTLSNSADVRTMGLHSEAEALGKNDFDLFPKEVAERFFADDNHILRTGEALLNREEYMLDANGQRQWLSTSKLPLKDQHGTIIGLMGIGREITMQKRAQESLEHERNLLRTVIDNMPNLFYFKGTDGSYILNNRAHLHSLGVERQEEVLGKTTFDFNPPELAARYSEDEKTIIRTGEPIEREELAFHKDKGQQRWHLTSKIPLKDAAGNVTGVLGISSDITERKQTEAEREQLIAELTRALADVKTLSGLVPICANCKKIRDDKGYWTQLEAYIQERTPAHFSHGICPDCAKILYPEFKSREKK